MLFFLNQVNDLDFIPNLSFPICFENTAIPVGHETNILYETFCYQFSFNPTTDHTEQLQ